MIIYFHVPKVHIGHLLYSIYKTCGQSKFAVDNFFKRPILLATFLKCHVMYYFQRHFLDALAILRTSKCYQRWIVYGIHPRKMPSISVVACENDAKIVVKITICPKNATYSLDNNYFNNNYFDNFDYKLPNKF